MPRPMSAAPDPQAEVLAFLADPTHWRGGTTAVTHVETHGAHVFLGRDRALKIKRAVHYNYMDFSTLARRRAVIEKEVTLNRRFAPDLYLGTIAVTREADGRLALGGHGAAVEWAVVMRRFDDAALLSSVCKHGKLTPTAVKALAHAVHDAHEKAPITTERDTVADLRRAIAAVTTELTAAGVQTAEAFEARATAALDAVTPLLEARRVQGHVRRCHGDLHLGNIVMLDGRPTLFDALEFDDALATIDTLYDLAFLLMDLDVAARRAEANLLLAQYLWLSGHASDIRALAALPLFLGLRAAIRAMVGYQRARSTAEAASNIEARRHADDYLAHAFAYLKPPAPRLVAVGGLSGTGKSTLAASLAPRFGAVPGALHLRSDLERKRLAGVGETERLPDSAYTAAASAAVYQRLLERAHAALSAGHAVIVDAVFQRPDERTAFERLAQELGAPFDGVWLTLAEADMLARIEARQDDASDATAAVARAQLARDAGPLTWQQHDAGGPPDAVAARVWGQLEARHPIREPS